MPDNRFETASVRAARYRARAAEMREQALAAVSEKLRTILIENAELYDQLAEQAERNGGTEPTGV
jgi:hypothetical protein